MKKYLVPLVLAFCFLTGCQQGSGVTAVNDYNVPPDANKIMPGDQQAAYMCDLINSADVAKVFNTTLSSKKSGPMKSGDIDSCNYETDSETVLTISTDTRKIADIKDYYKAMKVPPTIEEKLGVGDDSILVTFMKPNYLYFSHGNRTLAIESLSSDFPLNKDQFLTIAKKVNAKI